MAAVSGYWLSDETSFGANDCVAPVNTNLCKASTFGRQEYGNVGILVCLKNKRESVFITRPGERSLSDSGQTGIGRHMAVPFLDTYSVLQMKTNGWLVVSAFGVRHCLGPFPCALKSCNVVILTCFLFCFYVLFCLFVVIVVVVVLFVVAAVLFVYLFWGNDDLFTIRATRYSKIQERSTFELVSCSCTGIALSSVADSLLLAVSEATLFEECIPLIVSDGCTKRTKPQSHRQCSRLATWKFGNSIRCATSLPRETNGLISERLIGTAPPSDHAPSPSDKGDCSCYTVTKNVLG